MTIPIQLESVGLMSTHIRPRAVDAKDQVGTCRVAPEDAWQHRFVELNQDNSSLIMAFDIDREDAWEWVDTLIGDGVIVEPSWRTLNTESNHIQFAYVLTDPVHRNPDSRPWPIRYYEDIRAAINVATAGDTGMAQGGIMRNPTHPEQFSVFHTSRPNGFKLVDLITRTVRSNMQKAREARKARRSNYEKRTHYSFGVRKTRGASTPKAMSDAARKAQAIGVANRRSRTAERDNQIIRWAANGIPVSEIVESSGVSKVQIYNILKRAKRESGSEAIAAPGLETLTRTDAAAHTP